MNPATDNMLKTLGSACAGVQHLTYGVIYFALSVVLIVVHLFAGVNEKAFVTLVGLFSGIYLVVSIRSFFFIRKYASEVADEEFGGKTNEPEK